VSALACCPCALLTHTRASGIRDKATGRQCQSQSLPESRQTFFTNTNIGDKTNPTGFPCCRPSERVDSPGVRPQRERRIHAPYTHSNHVLFTHNGLSDRGQPRARPPGLPRAHSMYVCMYRFGGTSTRACTRTQARGATPELRRVTDTTPHGLSAGRHSRFSLYVNLVSRELRYPKAPLHTPRVAAWVTSQRPLAVTLPPSLLAAANEAAPHHSMA